MVSNERSGDTTMNAIEEAEAFLKQLMDSDACDEAVADAAYELAQLRLVAAAAECSADS
jgi:hypothetical protein